MSEAQDVSSILQRRDSRDQQITRQKSEINEEKDESDQKDELKNPKSESASTPRSDEPEKNFGGTLPDCVERARAQQQQQQQLQQSRQQQQPQQQLQQSRVGECNNLLPVLVERLRSALELSCSSQSSEDQLPLEDSGVDSEEDLRLWTTGFGRGASTNLVGLDQRHEVQGKPKLDLKFLEDLLLADIHTALARLQDTLKRVDIGTLTRYSASLDSTNKYYLLRLISSLLAKLKVPEEAISKPRELELRSHVGPKRRKNERHTIGVSADEIARARLWLDDKCSSSNESSPKIGFDSDNHAERIVEGAPATAIEEIKALEKSGIEGSVIFEKGTFNDKCMKDAINQQQSLQNKNHRDLFKENSRAYDSLEKIVPGPRKYKSYCKDDILVDNFQDRSELFYQQNSNVPTRQNKFTAKKSKLKRANTIDIPNYLQLKSESPDQIQNGCFALRRPIDVGDRVANGHQKVVPSFEPKTDNDRKFLALINKNTDSNTNTSKTPFKSFNYRQPSTVTDKNWSNRFSSIKTNFDKPQDNEEDFHRKPNRTDLRKKFDNVRDDSLEREGMVFGSTRVSYGPAKQKENGFTHAPTSPFQKIEKSSPKPESVPPFMKPGYIPKNSSMLQAKLKMFDQDTSKTSEHNNLESSAKMKNKFSKQPDNAFNAAQPINKRTQDSQVLPQEMENGHPNYYSFCKQFAPFASGKTNPPEGKSNINTTKSKLLTNLNKESDGSELKKDKSKALHQEAKAPLSKLHADDSRHHFNKQYTYRKPEDSIKADQDITNQQNILKYRQLDKKPQFSSPIGSIQVDSDLLKPAKPPKTFETSMQSVAVQTTREPTERRPSEPEVINTIAGISQDDLTPVLRIPKSNASVQTTSSSNLPLLQHVNQNSTEPSLSLGATSPLPLTHISYKSQPSHPILMSTPHYPIYQHGSTNQVPPSYDHTNYIPDQNYLPKSESYVYASEPSRQYGNYASNNENSGSTHSTELPHTGISQKLYNEFSKLPEPQPPRDFNIKNYNKNDDSVFNPVSAPYNEVISDDEGKIAFKPIPTIYENKILPDLLEENIENQDISSDGVVTRYTCAIATVSSMPESPEPTLESQSPLPQPYEPVVPRIKEPQPRHFAETTSISTPTDRKVVPDVSFDEIQRHNMLQQSLIRRMQNEQHQQPEKLSPARRFSQEIVRKENRSPTSPSLIHPGRVCALKALNESRKAQEKISLFEEKKLNNQQLFRPVNVPPKANIVNPMSLVHSDRAPIRNNASPVDSSDEYLMSCANKPSRHLVLSKSESWHQLALGKGTGGLQLPQPVQQKPPKPKSPSALRLSKQFEASAASENMRKMEEKVQRYFQSSSNNLQMSESRQSSRKNKRNLQSKKNMNSLMRSQTMPHLYDDRLFDENVDVDQAFDSIFKEATRSDNRH